MRLTRLNITRWRNLRDLAFDISPDANLVGLVGSNGTGKTNLLELASFAAAHFGLAAGVRSQQRPVPPADACFSVVLHVSKGFELPPDALVRHIGAGAQISADAWDRTLTLYWLPAPLTESDIQPGFRVGQQGPVVLAGGVDSVYAEQFARAVVEAISGLFELNHLFLDAERSYGPFGVQDAQILAASREDQTDPSRARQGAARGSADMYQEWIRDALGLEHRHDAEFAQAHRDAAASGDAGPLWSDPWTAYRKAVGNILPHLDFVRPDHSARTLVFRTGAGRVPYYELSGGEREVAFLVGQILRFGLKRGLLLIDEPELHLNAELLERWLRWASQTVTEGQVWMATHSLEAVEVMGPGNTLVLERDPDGFVRHLAPLAHRPVMTALSGALGAPAFSLDRQRFILIEGERPGVERQRFARLCPDTRNLFLESGNCRQVMSKLALIRDLAVETDRLHVGGVIDRDNWNARHRARFIAEAPVHILGVHEVENFFLMPDALHILAQRDGKAPGDSLELLRNSSDRFAGHWILQWTSLNHDIDLGPAVRRTASEMGWTDIETDREAAVSRLTAVADLEDHEMLPLAEKWLTGAVERYAEARESETLWARCSGKQVLGPVAAALGLAGPDALERQVLTLLDDGEVTAPEELVALRAYVAGLSAAHA